MSTNVHLDQPNTNQPYKTYITETDNIVERVNLVLAQFAQDNKNLKNSIEDLRKETEFLKQENAELKQENIGLNKKITDQQNQLADQQEENRQIQQKLVNIERQLHSDYIKNGIVVGGVGGAVEGAWSAFLYNPSPSSVFSGFVKGCGRGVLTGIIGSEVLYRHKQKKPPFHWLSVQR